MPRTASEYGEEECYAIEERIHPHQSMRSPEPDVSIDSKEDPGDEQQNGKLYACNGDAVEHVAVVRYP